MANIDQTQWKLGQLDALRGIAILGVLGVHTLAAAPFVVHPGPFVFALLLSGQRGVQLFYIVSAFTLALSEDRRKTEQHTRVSFFIRRFFRIAPMFYVAVLLTHWLRPNIPGTWKDMLMAMTFVNGFSPDNINHSAVGGWSVADEAIFYAILPLLFRLVGSLRSAAIAFVLSAVTSVVLIHTILGSGLHTFTTKAMYFKFFSMVAELPVFLMGLLAYQVWKSMRSLPLQGRKEVSICLVLIAGLLYALLLPFDYARLLLESMSLMVLALGVSLYPWKVLVNQITIFLGKISFSLYLLHSLAFLSIGELLHRRYPSLDGFAFAAAMFLVGVSASVPLAVLTWHFVEKPGIQFGSFLIRKLSRKVIPDLAPVPQLTGVRDTAEAQF
ncbi:acyltransferase family protein [Terriglobus sp.]|uniref:acyltransferase family protein n=1 Tax=Terriglobus sp. TaxID=1889013 RepID=UPI003B0085C3